MDGQASAPLLRPTLRLETGDGPDAALLKKDGGLTTPHIMRDAAAEYGGEGAGFMTPRTRNRVKGKRCCGVDLRNNPSLGTAINLTSCFIGGGVLGVPSAYESASIFPAIFLTLFCATLTVASLYFIIFVGEHGGEPDATIDSFAGLATVFGRKWGKVAMRGADCMAAVILFGVISAAQIIIKDNIVSCAAGLTSSGLPFAPWIPMALLTGVVIFPLTTLRKLDFLKYSSAGAIASVIYISVLIIMNGLEQKGELSQPVAEGDVVAFSWWEPASAVAFMKAAPLIVFSFGCQVQLPPLYAELVSKIDPNRETSAAYRIGNFVKVIVTAVGTFMLIVLAIGTFGCLAFPSKQKHYADMKSGDILKVFDSGYMPATVARMSLTLALAFMIPLLLWPVRVSLWAGMAFLNLGPSATEKKKAVGSEMPYFYHVALSLLILLVTTLIAALLDNLGLVFSVLGAVGGSIMFYIYPASCFVVLVKTHASRGTPLLAERTQWMWLALGYLLIGFGLLMCVLGTAAIFM